MSTLTSRIHDRLAVRRAQRQATEAALARADQLFPTQRAAAHPTGPEIDRLEAALFADTVEQLRAERRPQHLQRFI